MTLYQIQKFCSNALQKASERHETNQTQVLLEHHIPASEFHPYHKIVACYIVDIKKF